MSSIVKKQMPELNDDVWGVIKEFLFERKRCGYDKLKKMTRYELYYIMLSQKFHFMYSDSAKHCIRSLKHQKNKIDYDKLAKSINNINMINKTFKTRSTIVLNRNGNIIEFFVICKKKGMFVMCKTVIDDASGERSENGYYNYHDIIKFYESK